MPMLSPGAMREPATVFQRHLHSRLTGLVTYLLMGVAIVGVALIAGTAIGAGIAWVLGLPDKQWVPWGAGSALLLAVAAILFAVRDYRRRVGAEVRVYANRVEIDLETGVRAVPFDAVDLARIEWDRWGSCATLDLPVFSGATLSIPAEQYPIQAIAVALRERLQPRSVEALAELALDRPVAFVYDRAALRRRIAGSIVWGLAWLALGAWAVIRWDWAKDYQWQGPGVGIAIIFVIGSFWNVCVNSLLLRVPPVVLSREGLRVGDGGLVPWAEIQRIENDARGLVLTRSGGDATVLPPVYPKFPLLADLAMRLAGKRGTKETNGTSPTGTR